VFKIRVPSSRGVATQTLTPQCRNCGGSCKRGGFDQRRPKNCRKGRQLDRYEMMEYKCFGNGHASTMGHILINIAQGRDNECVSTVGYRSSTLLLATIIKSMNSTIKDPLFVIIVVVLHSSPPLLTTRDFPALALVAFRRLPYWSQKFPISQ
jgi:hypothetical protein